MKNLQNLGKVLSKQEQQSINGGDEGEPGCRVCAKNSDCGTNGICAHNTQHPGCQSLTCGCGSFCF